MEVAIYSPNCGSDVISDISLILPKGTRVTFFGDNDLLRASKSKILAVWSTPSPRAEPFFKDNFDEKMRKFLFTRGNVMFVALQWAKADLDPVQWGNSLPSTTPRTSLPFHAVPQFDTNLIATKVAMQMIAEFLKA